MAGSGGGRARDGVGAGVRGGGGGDAVPRAMADVMAAHAAATDREVMDALWEAAMASAMAGGDGGDVVVTGAVGDGVAGESADATAEAEAEAEVEVDARPATPDAGKRPRRRPSARRVTLAAMAALALAATAASVTPLAMSVACHLYAVWTGGLSPASGWASSGPAPLAVAVGSAVAWGLSAAAMMHAAARTWRASGAAWGHLAAFVAATAAYAAANAMLAACGPSALPMAAASLAAATLATRRTWEASGTPDGAARVDSAGTGRHGASR